jgi:cytochrome o ubiquinol oxidase operon protein cyoD
MHQEEAIHGDAWAGKATLRSYLTGFALAVVLTIIPFALVIGDVLPFTTTIAILFAVALLQVLVHLHYFLHLDTTVEERWNLSAILVTAVIVALLAGGGIWIMASLHARTMSQASISAMMGQR